MVKRLKTVCCVGLLMLAACSDSPTNLFERHALAWQVSQVEGFTNVLKASASYLFRDKPVEQALADRETIGKSNESRAAMAQRTNTLANSIASVTSKAGNRQRRSQPRNEPFQCPETQYINMTREEGVAISYALERENRMRGHDARAYCVESITATNKVPFRGDTLVQYRLIRMYPRGYRTACLEQRPPNEAYWDRFLHEADCNALNTRRLGPPIEPGGRRYVDGEIVI